MSINLYDVNGSQITNYDQLIYYIDSDMYKPLGVKSCRLLSVHIGKARASKLMIDIDPVHNGKNISITGLCIGNKDYKFPRLFNIPHGQTINNQIRIEDKSIDFDKDEFIRQWRDCLKADPANRVTLNVSNMRFDIVYDIKHFWVHDNNNRKEFLLKEFALNSMNDMFRL